MNQQIAICIVLLCSLAMNAVGQIDTVLLKAFGASYYEEATDVIRNSQNGYTMVGTTGSNETGSTDLFIAAIDDELNCVWSKNYGNAEVDWGMSIVEDLSGNYLVCGYTLGSSVSSYDMLVLKVNAQGDLMWQQTYGGADWDFARKIIAHPLGGFLICGSTYSDGNGDEDAVILHIDGQGVLLHEWLLGGAGKDAANDMLALSDGWITGGFQTMDGLEQATLWKLDLAGNVQWTRVAEDANGYGREVNAVASANGYIYATGPVFTDLGTKSFEFRIPLDNTAAFEVVETQDFDFIYRDCVSVDDRIVFVGSKLTSGIELGRVVRKHSDLYFTGVFEFTGQERAKFNSVIWNGDELVMCGTYQPTLAENWQAVLLKYSSPVLNEVNIEPELAPCFTVDVEEVLLPKPGETGALYNALGQLVEARFTWDVRYINQTIPAGIYFFQVPGRKAHRVFID